MALLQQVIAEVEKHFPIQLAEAWDSVGLIAGNRSSEVSKILLSVDIDNDVLDEAISLGAQLVISHHPLALARHNIVEHPYKFRTAARAVAQGIALYNAHTNADSARNGVCDALADALGVSDTFPILSNQFDPLLGIGRIGELQAETDLTNFVRMLASAVPGARARVAGRERPIKSVAVCAGAGDSLLPHVARADVFVTSDLRHHAVAEHLEAGGCPVIDINHFAAERLWLPRLAEVLQRIGVQSEISTVDTSHWWN